MTYPLIASLATEVFAVPKEIENGNTMGTWTIEPKIDGHRILVDYRGDTPRILNRNGRTYSAGPFRLTVPDALRGCVIDGEYLPQDRRFVAFDLLKAPGDEDLNYRRILPDRRNGLYAVFADVADASWWTIPHHRAGMSWVDFYRQEALAGGIRLADDRLPVDGVVFKRQSTDYVPGKNDYWRKLKFLSDIDCVVTALNIDGKSNCELSLHDPLSGTTFSVGKASTSGKIGVKINSVVTVRFLKFTGSRLREPRIVQVRDDKSPESCEISQLIPFVPHLKGE